MTQYRGARSGSPEPALTGYWAHSCSQQAYYAPVNHARSSPRNPCTVHVTIHVIHVILVFTVYRPNSLDCVGFVFSENVEIAVTKVLHREWVTISSQDQLFVFGCLPTRWLYIYYQHWQHRSRRAERRTRRRHVPCCSERESERIDC